MTFLKGSVIGPIIEITLHAAAQNRWRNLRTVIRCKKKQQKTYYHLSFDFLFSFYFPLHSRCPGPLGNSCPSCRVWEFLPRRKPPSHRVDERFSHLKVNFPAPSSVALQWQRAGGTLHETLLVKLLPAFHHIGAGRLPHKTWYSSEHHQRHPHLLKQSPCSQVIVRSVLLTVLKGVRSQIDSLKAYLPDSTPDSAIPKVNILAKRLELLTVPQGLRSQTGSLKAMPVWPHKS